MPAPNLRHSARALVLDEDERVLLCRFLTPDGRVVWATPGGGVEPGETVQEALRRELDEEIGLRIDGDPPHVWRRRVVTPGHVTGFDGVEEDVFLVRTPAFDPRGSMSDAQLAAENVTGFAWWTLDGIAAHRGPEVFAPRDLAELVAALLRTGVPAEPPTVGW